MASGRSPGGAHDLPERPRRGGTPNEQGLRALGAQMSGGGASPQSANEQGLRNLGDQIDRAHGGKGGGGKRGGGGGGSPGGGAPRRHRHRRRIVTARSVIVVVALLAVAASYGYARYRFDQLKKVDVSSLTPYTGGPFNMLVIGSDSRVGLTGAAAAQAGSAALVTGQRSDVIMVWRVVPATKQITIMSIPRDTLVTMVGDQANLGNFNRINSTFDSGPNLLVQTIEANFGIPINHVLQVSFGGFQGSVDALGGVYMDFPFPAKDAYSGRNITTPGCQLLNGTEALAVARSRHYEYYENGYWQYDGTSDFGRIQRQDAFLKALVDAAKSKYNPVTINAFLGSIPQGIVIDNSFSLSELVGLAIDFHSLNPAALDTLTMPTISNGYVSPWGDVLFTDQPAAQEMFTTVFGSSLKSPTSPPPNTSLETVPPPVVTPTTAAPASPTSGASSVTTTTQAPPPSFDPTPCTP